MTEKEKENAKKGTDNNGTCPSSRIDKHEFWMDMKKKEWQEEAGPWACKEEKVDVLG